MYRLESGLWANRPRQLPGHLGRSFRAHARDAGLDMNCGGTPVHRALARFSRTRSHSSAHGPSPVRTFNSFSFFLFMFLFSEF
jgi:hypothetical protein